jgi:hypothetical protein
MDFDEALGHFARVDPAELPTRTNEGPVRLQEDDAGAHFLVYMTDRGVRHELRYEGDQPWFTQKQLADMFGVAISTTNEHIKHFTSAGELGDSVIRDFRITATDGKTYTVKHYSLDVAFYVGYRVNSTAGVLFRRWATALLVQFATNGFVIDKERLKAPDAESRVDEIKSILQDIRSEQANVHRDLEQICAQCQDYSPDDPNWKKFFRGTPAKIFYAAVQYTPSEIIMERAKSEHQNMGLVT